jgi:fimbrial chaperone protein
VIFVPAIRRYLLAAVLLAYGAGCAAVADAAGVTISPVVLEIDSPRKAIAVTVTNSGDRPITFQTDTLVWRQIDGADRYESTDELLVVPPIVEVPPKGSQVLRLMLRSPRPSPMERTYRLVLEDITEELAAATGQASISFKFSHRLPVMIAPSGKVLNAVRWKPCLPEAVTQVAEACVRLINAGNRRVKVQKLTLAGDGWQQELSLKDGENVLAGAEREWHVPLVQGQVGALRSVQVQTARGEMLQAEAGGF